MRFELDWSNWQIGYVGFLCDKCGNVYRKYFPRDLFRKVSCDMCKLEKTKGQWDDEE